MTDAERIVQNHCLYIAMMNAPKDTPMRFGVLYGAGYSDGIKINRQTHQCDCEHCKKAREEQK